MAGPTSLTPNINVNTTSSQLRTELLNTFSRLDGQLSAVPFKLNAQTGPISSSGSAETNLVTYTLDPGTLGKLTSSILIFASGKTAANANNKTIKLIFGSTTLFTSGALALNNKDWTLQAELIYNGGSSQISWAQFQSSGSAAIITTTTATEAFATSQVLKITGTGTATSDIDIYSWKLILLK